MSNLIKICALLREMEKYAYTLKNLQEYAVGAHLQFTELFIWFVVRQISTQLISYHLNNRIYHQLKPSNVTFYGGDILLRVEVAEEIAQRQKPSLVDKFYQPPEEIATIQYDIFPLGQIVHSMTQLSPLYSDTLYQLMQSMYQYSPEKRPTSSQVLQTCNRYLSREKQQLMQRFEEEYGKLYKSYAIEYESFLRRSQKEFEEIKQKKAQLTRMENAFFYAPPQKFYGL